jgi:hypothetical protein
MERDILNELKQLVQALTSKMESMEHELQNMNASSIIQDWVDEETTKRITGLSKSTLYNLRRAGKLTSSKLSERKLFYRISDLSKLLDHNEKA